jgi:glucuronate isomerase
MLLNDDFLLTNDWSKILFHNHAKHMPIIDYHCHLNPKEIYEDQCFENITDAWLRGDHYKWRLMRACGVPETLITGTASDYDKFYAWCQTVPKIIGNPLYTWSHLELRRFFDIHTTINEENAAAIWAQANEKLSTKKFSRRNLIVDSQVKIICTTDDPIDDLHHHELLRESESRFSVYPTFRPDKGINIELPTYPDWIEALENIVGAIECYDDLLNAFKERITYFHAHGCRLSDHALDDLCYEEADEKELNAILVKARNKEMLTPKEIDAYKTQTILHLISYYNAYDWAVQLHIHAYRNCNTEQFLRLGPDKGYDAINDTQITSCLQKLLNQSESENQLPKTILYTLNPNDYPALVSLMGCFQKDIPGKIQLGSGWWFNDTFAGMNAQLTALSEGGVLSQFVGMLTDSRSFISYTRHEYFRRVLCEHLGQIVVRGEAPEDESLLGGIAEAISYHNANSYFGF